VESEALIAAIVAEPDAVAPFLQYADWLLDQGDPRGELIQLQLIAESGGATDAHRIWIKALLADEDRLLSPRLADAAHYWHLRFRRGFIRSAALCGGLDDPPALDAVDALVADPHAGLLAWIALNHPCSESVPYWQPVLAAERPHLRELVVANFGSGAELLHHAPNLQVLDLLGGPVERLAHDRLRVLRCSLVLSTLAAPDLAAMKRGASGTFPGAYDGGFELPALEELSWMLGEQDTLGDHRSIFHRPPPRLHTLALSGREDSFRELVRCELMRQLRELELSVTFRLDFNLLLELAPALRHLEILTVKNSRTELEHAEMLELRTAFERALPNTKLKIPWDRLVRGERAPRVTTDHESRDPDGQIDAIGTYIQDRSR